MDSAKDYQKKDYQILLIDKDQNIREYFLKIFNSIGYTVFPAESCVSGINFLEAENIDLIVADVEVFTNNDNSFYKIVKEKYGNIINVSISKTIQVDTQIDLYKLGIDKCLSKKALPSIIEAEIDVIYEKNINSKVVYNESLKAISSSFVTINHEINNPLTIIRSAVIRLKKNNISLYEVAG